MILLQKIWLSLACSYRRWNHLLKFSIHLSVKISLILQTKISRENCKQIYWKSKESVWRNFGRVTTPQNWLVKSFAVTLVYNSYFFQNSRFTEIIRHYIRFEYKLCNFSHGCLLVKMAFKTVIIKAYSLLFHFI